MKVSELKQILDKYEKLHPDLMDKDVVIKITSPSMGPTPSVGVSEIYFGIDWDSNKAIIKPNIDLDVKTDDAIIFDMARELLLYIATKPVKNASYEIRQARRIFEAMGVDYMKLQNIMHRFE